MPSLLERPKMTKLMYQTLKRHIIRERDRKKRAEQEQDLLLEQQKKEREMKKKKEEDNNLTLEQTKEQMSVLVDRLENLRQEKHRLFSQLKTVLNHEDDIRKCAQLKEQSELLSMQPPYTQPTMPPVSAHSALHPHGRPQLYRPVQTSSTISTVPNVPMKRPRSPSPPPSTTYQFQYDKKTPTSLYSAQDFKPGAYPQQGQLAVVTYVSQPIPSFQQSSVAYTTSKSPNGKYQSTQSAFSTYPSHYVQHQKSMQEPPVYATSYQIQRMQQPGYLVSPHASGIPLQQQLQQANDKAGFNDGDKYKLQQQSQIRGVGTMQVQQPGMMPILPQDVANRGSIVSGFSGRNPAAPNYQSSNTQGAYSGQQSGTPSHPGFNANTRHY